MDFLVQMGLTDFLAQYSVPWLVGLTVALLITGIVAGLLAGLLGVGGGIVIVPVLYHLFTLLGVDPEVRMHVAVGTSLATIIPTSIISARAHRKRGSLDKQLLRRLIPSVLVGVVLGAVASQWLSGQVLTTVFAVIALLVAANMGLRKEALLVRDELPGTVGTSLIGSGIGGISTLMGIGGGTLSVPILSAFKTPMHVAVGTGAALGMVISLPGAIGFLINGIDVANRPPFTVGYVNLAGLALIVPMTMLLAPYGARLAHSVDARRLRQLFALFLFLTALRMLYGLLR
ncbi:sulfite exporter TauE/SafE family protein [Pseudomonas sp.]|uniref:sulfite exporter TauE/SafE family protein n=1 Tax=Pseudomonas sp. TaxID=306 RepID=UPI002B8DC328|nr:sulfite exporter TauE/SafE family protein [Pseudomonas sp.]HUE92309.1 sulfite exporter TauE/SafE family protein [Pseudomonas sp.]